VQRLYKLFGIKGLKHIEQKPNKNNAHSINKQNIYTVVVQFIKTTCLPVCKISLLMTRMAPCNPLGT
jgi:hypothetical protein